MRTTISRRGALTNKKLLEEASKEWSKTSSKSRGEELKEEIEREIEEERKKQEQEAYMSRARRSKEQEERIEKQKKKYSKLGTRRQAYCNISKHAGTSTNCTKNISHKNRGKN